VDNFASNEANDGPNFSLGVSQDQPEEQVGIDVNQNKWDNTCSEKVL